MAMIYRMHTPEEIPTLVKFWSENAGWDQIDRTEWERRFHYTPYGKASVVVAIDKENEEIIGHVLYSIPHHKIDFRFAGVYFSLMKKGLLKIWNG